MYIKRTYYVQGVYMKPKKWSRVEVLDNNHMPVKNGWTNINLRIPNDLLNDIDERVKERVGIKRTGWILEAIQIAIQVCKGEV